MLSSADSFVVPLQYDTAYRLTLAETGRVRAVFMVVPCVLLYEKVEGTRSGFSAVYGGKLHQILFVCMGKNT